MELALKRNGFSICETGAEVTLTQEASAETIVPDYCPDIGRIVDADGKIFIHNRELRDGRAEVTGTVRVSVLYTPEGEGGIRVLDLAMPFSAESEQNSLGDCSMLTAETEMEFLETRMLNPRKLFTHCKVVLYLTGYRRSQLEICADAEAEEDLGVEKRTENQHTVFLMQVAEKEFTFSEEMAVPSGRGEAVEILRSQICSTVTETRIAGNKLIFKGVFVVTVLYRTPEGAYKTVSGELPFSQLMEIEGGHEEGTADLNLQLTGSDFQIGEAGRQIGMTFYVHATAEVREEQELTLLSDLYSNAYLATYEARPLTLISSRDLFKRRQPVREILEIGTAAERILYLTACCGPTSISREGNQAVLRTGAVIRALYQEEGGALLLAERCVDIVCKSELSDNSRIIAKAACPDEVQGSLTEKGIEVRFQVEFQIETLTEVKKVCITAVHVDREQPQDLAGMPSLVLRRMGEGENAWALAKMYHSNIAAILAANQAEREEDLPRNRLLLIPRKRN